MEKRLTGRSRGIGCIEDTLCRRMMIEDGSIQEDPLCPKGLSTQAHHACGSPYHTNHSFTPNQFYPIWGHPNNHHSSMQMWGHPGFPTWHPQDSWSWNTHPWMHADAWGRPMMPPSPGPCSNFP
ncbi:hypothetical protein IFM89_032288 [Coptis chinensis]|uniref:Uncharacterized protein n=1 Tax=Coptis chinensis TaxID=261450 RepID=A0A835H166_9MAGN|nr:hypothetical protein IFM89_032288 [Coptis chinensis]